MFTRVAEIAVKAEKREEFFNLVHNELQPTLKAQTGFVDAVGLISDTDPNSALSIVFWTNKELADRFYSGTTYINLMQKLRPLMKNDLKVRTYTVDTSTFHHIARGKAA
jgi:quinol monooxygenase YgiN